MEAAIAAGDDTHRLWTYGLQVATVGVAARLLEQVEAPGVKPSQLLERAARPEP